MKAILYTSYGPPDVLQLREINKPSPGENEVLVKVFASSINAIEWRRFTMPRAIVRIFGGGIREPRDKSIGGDLAGRVEAVGANVKRFRPGDEVFGVRRGAFAEYVCATEDKLAPKPANVSFEAAATVPIAGLTALQALRDKGNIQPGQHVLVNQFLILNRRNHVCIRVSPLGEGFLCYSYSWNRIPSYLHRSRTIYFKNGNSTG